MKKAAIPTMLLLVILFAAAAQGGVMAELKDQRLSADTRGYPGDILRPRICPSDSN